MASKTKRTESIRRKKNAGKGTKRKSLINTKGSTKSAKELFGDNK